ncbi:MAG: hypothetical protein J6S23_02430 [Clostridia bacterium]|nr:hypothetical protein [Clostridia bacterium]
MLHSPCYTCDKCPCKYHDSCPDYAEYQSKLQELRREKLRYSDVIGYVNQSIIKYQRKHRK